jgi:anthranilate phosphoribosyltransferase
MQAIEAIRLLLAGGHLGEQGMRQVVDAMLDGQLSPVQMAAVLVLLQARGEREEELLGAARALRHHAEAISVPDPGHLLDTCGTGGDRRGLFNVSTTAAFVAAAAGARVAKHGNVAISGRSGSADVLLEAGACVDLEPSAVVRCIEEVGFGFLLAPRYHSTTQAVQAVRRELGVRTIFNLLGPLTNPAHAGCQLIGIFDRAHLIPMAHVAGALGGRHVLVVHSEDGCDEISIAAPTAAAEWRDGKLHTYTIRPQAVGVSSGSIDTLVVHSAAESLRLLREVLGGAQGPARHMVVINAAAALYVAGVAEDLPEGVCLAEQALDSGAAEGRFEAFCALSQSLAAP